MDKRNAFVLMPFKEDLADVYEYLIVEGLTDAGYSVKRADDILSQSNILEDILAGITSSDLIVADLTGSNPNVYYELGIAHALNKKVILLTQSVDELPFDLRSYRVITYSVHFAKMNQAKSELSHLASEALKGKVPFGNPVKDFNGKSNTYQSESSSVSFEEDEPESEYGFLDYRVKLEEGFEELAELITSVGTKLEQEVVPEVRRSGDKLNSGKYSTKEQRNIVKDLAGHLQNYGVFLKPSNEKYRAVLKDVEDSLEYILSGELDLDKNAEKELEEFIDVLIEIEVSASGGRQEFATLIETMDAIPKIEKTFNRSKVFMSSELKEFVDNIDQTIAVISRASRLGNYLLSKITSN
jgi:hypothetical protein